MAPSASPLFTAPAAATATERSFDAGTATVTVPQLDGSADILRRGGGIDRCDPGAPGVGESVGGCET